MQHTQVTKNIKLVGLESFWFPDELIKKKEDILGLFLLVLELELPLGVFRIELLLLSRPVSSDVVLDCRTDRIYELVAALKLSLLVC